MATSEENDLIGYDPLAWMEDSVDDSEEPLDESDTDNKIRMINDYPEDLIVAAEEGAVLSEPDVTKEDFISDEINVANDSATIDETVEEYVDAVADDCMDAGGRATQGAVADESEEMVGSQIDLDATLSIQHVVDLHERLKKTLAFHDQIEINASDVASIDTATLQLLVSLKKDAEKLHKQVSIIYPSPRFVESAQLLGLLDVLDVHGF